MPNVIRKEYKEGGWMEGLGADFMSINRHFMEHGLGQPHAGVDFNPTS